MSSRIVYLLGLLPLALQAPAAAAGALPAFAQCEEQLAAQPQARHTAECFYTVGKQPSLGPEAIRRLQRLVPRYPNSPWLHFYLGSLLWPNPEASAAASRAAIQGFVKRGDGRGEVLARFNLCTKLYEQGRNEEAGYEAERARATAERLQDPELIARARVNLARHLQRTGGDLSRGLLLLQQARPALFADGAYLAQRDWLLFYSDLVFELGWHREAKASLHQLIELTAAQGRTEAFAEAKARYGLARVAFAEATELPSEATIEEARRHAREAMAMALIAQHSSVEAHALYVLGSLGDSPTARAYLERCVAAAPTHRDRSSCLHALARHLAKTDPGAAQAALERAFELARSADDPYALIYCWRERMRLAWVDGTSERAIAEGRAALEVIEALHGVQRNTDRRAELASTWAEDYHWFAGQLLRTGKLGDAWAIVERMRARSLVEEVQRGGAASRGDPATLARRASVLEELAQAQRRLLDPRLSGAERSAARREQERLELADAELLDRLAESAPALRRPDFASLREIQGALAPDEVLLSFQVAPWRDMAGRFAGGAWLLAVTRRGARVYPLPGRVELRPTLAMFDGLFAARVADAEAPAARGLYRRLLGRALAELPVGIERLIVVPDDHLHGLPFAALRTADGKPLVRRYQLTVVPSATLWLRWRRERPAPGAPALALADPPLPGGGKPRASDRGAPVERAAVFAAMQPLPPLPYARDEGRTVVRHLGRGSLLRTGDSASEAFLKRHGGGFGLYHFAAHALLDDERPERSGVVLAPGARNQDGLLQAREIAELDLRGAAVVLASCRSASGVVLRGEGVMGLARAFFQAGAHAVVASLWPLRDDEAEALFASFYRRLGRGEGLAAALRAAQAERIAAGAPAIAWAGLVVLGDGELVPVRPRPLRRWIATALLAAVGAGALVFAWRPGGVG